jgi:CDP-diacylglycerol--glycerol-3-phosphate 3-phosphatidyltransferase
VINWSFSDWCRDWFRPYLLLVARFLGWLGLSPNMVSIIGLIAYGASGLVLGMGHPAAAGWLLAVFGPLDAVDGLLAREQGRVSSFGAFLDSTVDRYAEFFLFLGLMAYLMLHRQCGLLEAALVLAAMTGSLLVSYTRARAEALDFNCKVGVLTRFERLFLFAVGLIFGWIYPILVILAVFTHITALQRIIHVYKQSSD